MDWLFAYTDPTIDWEYAMLTLVVRFIGVFVVMALVQVALQTASHVIRRIEARSARHAAAAKPTPAVVSLDVSSIAAHEAELDGPAVAAIGLALALEAGAGAAATGGRSPGATVPARASAWGMSARLRGLR